MGLTETYTVTGVAKKIIDGKDVYHLITNKEGQPDKWLKCSEKVRNYLGAIKPAIITVDQMTDDIIEKVNLVQKIDTPGAKSEPSCRTTEEELKTFHKSDNSLSFLSTPGELDELDDLLSLAEDRINQATTMWELKRPTKNTKGALESLARHKKNLYKFMDRIK